MARVDFTRQQLLTFLREQNRTVGHSSDDVIEAAREFYRELSRVGSRDVDTVLEEISAFVDAHGVEPIRQEGAHVDNYHYDIIATYVNMGDTYAQTLLYDTEANTFYLTSYGDWLEGYEQEHRQEDVCVSCGQQFPADELTYDDDGTGATCRDCSREQEQPKPPPFWEPRDDQPLIAWLRSVEGAPIAVHFYAMGTPITRGTENEEPQLAFSMPYTGQDGVTHFVATPERDQYRENYVPSHHHWLRIIEHIRRDGSMYVCSGQSIETDQFQRLLVAMDRFFEAGMERQPARTFLETPPVLWTCRQVNEIQWIEGEHGHGQGDGVQAFVRRKEEIGSTIQSSDLVIWAAADDELQELIDDGFIQWKNDDSVREYLQSIGICRAK